MAQDPFGDIPLFRELQRLLSSGDGPVNYEIARQVGTAIATQGVSEPSVPAETARSFAEAVHASEVVVSGYTRLPLDEPLGSRVLNRAQWVAATLDSWKWLLNRLAGRFGGELGKLGGEETAGSLQTALGQIAPLLMGIQAGTLVGHLSREMLGRYDVPIPRDDDGKLFVVAPNVEAICADYGFDADTFRRWLALQEVTRGLIVNSVAWVDRYFRGLLTEIIDSIEIDASDLERRLMELQSQGPEALQEGLGAQGALPIVPTERHQRALGRLHAFMALFEGYARQTSAAVGGEVVGDTTKIDEGMARHTLSPSDGEEMLATLLGLSLDRALETAGATFCAAVLKLKGIGALNRVWEAPDNLPAIEEIKDPFAWIDRVLAES
jgi:putative hydrolase